MQETDAQKWTDCGQVPTWEEAKPWVRWQLVSAKSDLAGLLHERVSEQIALVLVLVAPDESQFFWIRDEMAAMWGQTKNSLFPIAVGNMDAIMAATDIEVTRAESKLIGHLGTDWEGYKAALVYSDSLRSKVEPVLGWPVYAAIPSRDFVFLVGAKDKDLLHRMAPLVLKEWAESSYPLSTELFELRGHGVRAVGDIRQTPPATGTPAETGWRDIEYAGRWRFRLPADWVARPVNDGLECLDPAGPGRFMVLAVKSRPDDNRNAEEFASVAAKACGGTAVRRDAETWVVESPGAKVTPPSHEAVMVWDWHLVSAAYPAPASFVTFTHYLPADFFESDPARYERERMMLRNVVMGAMFSANSTPQVPTAGEGGKAARKERN